MSAKAAKPKPPARTSAEPRTAGVAVAAPIEPLLRPDDVAAWLGCSTDTVARLCRDEGLPFRRMAGKRKRFVRADVQAWLDGRRVVATAAPVREGETEPVRAGGSAPAGGSWRDEIRKVGRAGK